LGHFRPQHSRDTHLQTPFRDSAGKSAGPFLEAMSGFTWLRGQDGPFDQITAFVLPFPLRQ
jgi:hypothetical protein